MLKLNLYFIFSILLVQGAFATKFLPTDFSNIQIVDEDIDTSISKRDEIIEKRHLDLLWWLNPKTVATCKPYTVPHKDYRHCPNPSNFDRQFTRGYDLDIYDHNYNLLKSTWALSNFAYSYSGLGLLNLFNWNCWFNPVKFHAKMNFYFKCPKSGYFSFNTVVAESAVLGVGAPQNGCCDYNQDQANIYGYTNKYNCFAKYPTSLYLEEGLIYPIEVIFNAVGRLNQKFQFNLLDAYGNDMNAHFYRPPTKYCPTTTTTLPKTTTSTTPAQVTTSTTPAQVTTTTTTPAEVTTTSTSSLSTIIITDMPTPTISGYYNSTDDEPCFVLDLPKEWSDFEFEEQKGDGYVWNNEFYFSADGTTVPAADYTLSADQSTVSFTYHSVFSTQAVFTACGSVTQATDQYQAVYTVSAKYGSIVVKRDGSEETVLAETTTTVTLTPVVTNPNYTNSVAAASTSTVVAKRDDDPVVQVINDKKVIKMNPIVVLDPNFKEDKRDTEPEAFEGAASALTLSKVAVALSFGVALLL
ncbi:hypothetical protein B5S29_g4127 [[Candida] boidinii]|uniref:Unnamed protein product n=1 Tax=Candida boidinii TaxID=5477 RepID=A0ACB5TH44_CANBO|nr:hypothetical protein B5S29_g4127 [[Candida] boidinii]GME88645.1 unnamed protein product [[Candida] boidinii]